MAGDLLQAASLAFVQLSANERCDFLRAIFRADGIVPSALHRRVATLGPSCFITTNYDDLLERALVTDVVGRRFDIVTPQDVVETATIVRAHARNFVFKPHGDIGSCASIVLTREDYREFQGSRRNIADALKTLLVSRPVVFIGFGLRDPDFLLIKDTLAVLYHGAAQDHYAIVPDVTHVETAYWRNHFGLHLVGYETEPSADRPGNGHGQLLPLLDRLAGDSALLESRREAAAAPASSAEEQMSLLRHARLVERLETKTPHERFPVRARPTSRGYTGRMRLFYGEDAATAIRGTKCSFVVTGSPGSGKSVAAREAAVRLAQELASGLLEDPARTPASKVPVYVDLKAYDGDLWALASETLAVGVDLKDLADRGVLVCFLDGVNEIRHEDLETNRFISDLQQFLVRVARAKVVIITRSAVGLESLDLPTVELDQIDGRWVSGQLEQRGVPEERRTHELISLLQRPLFFRLFEAGGFPADVRSPHQIYELLVERLEQDLLAQASVVVDLKQAFGRLAFERIDAGEQLMSMHSVLREIDGQLNGAVDARELVNWLISQDILLPVHGNRLLFFHHSVTEYLAAHHLVRIGSVDEDLLRRCLTRRQWDHAILLALGFLADHEQEQYVATIMQADPTVGLRALGFVDDPDRWLGLVLDGVIAARPVDFKDLLELASALGRVTFTASAEPALWKVVDCGDALGGEALAAIVEIADRPGIVREAVDRALDLHVGYNFRARVAVALASMLETSDEDVDYLLGRLVELTRDVPDIESELTGEESSWSELTWFAGEALTMRSIEDLAARVGSVTQAEPIHRAMLLARLYDDASDAGLGVAAELLQIDPAAAVVSMHFQLSRGSLRDETVDALNPDALGDMILAAEPADMGWAIRVLSMMSDQSSRWRGWTIERAGRSESGLERAALWAAGGDAERAAVALEGWLDTSPAEVGQSAAILGGLSSEFWDDREALFVRVLRCRDGEIAYAAVDSAHLAPGFGREALDVDDLAWWTDWLGELSESAALDLQADRVASFLSNALGPQDLDRVLETFVGGGEARRRGMADHLLEDLSFLRLDLLEGSMLDWLVDDMSRRRSASFKGPVLGVLATEGFVEQEILTKLAASPGDPLRANLVDVALAAGKRHGRRYVAMDGEILV